MVVGGAVLVRGDQQGGVQVVGLVGGGAADRVVDAGQQVLPRERQTRDPAIFRGRVPIMFVAPPNRCRDAASINNQPDMS